MSRVNKLSKSDEVLAAQEYLKGCWISGDIEIQNDAFLLMAAVGQMNVLQEGITAELKTNRAFTISMHDDESHGAELMMMNALIRANLGIDPSSLNQ